MTALYFRALRPQDRVAVKPHASPIYHAIQYLLGRQTRQKLEDFRGYKGAQSYPSRTKDADDVDFSTGSVGLGVAQTLFSSLVQDYVRAHGWGLERPEGRMIALVGDAELDEGNIFEAILEGWKQGLRNCWWIIDYNRQSLDAVIREGLWARYEALFQAFGWDVVILKYGSLLQRGVPRARRRATAPVDRQLPEPALLRARVPGRRRLAQAAPRRDRRPGPGHAADRGPLRRRAGAADDQSRRPRPAVAARRLRQGRPRPADLLHLLHHQGLRAAVRRPQGQPCRPDDAGADGKLPRRDERPARPRMGQVRRPGHRADTLQNFLDRVPFAAGAPPSSRRAHPGAGALAGHHAAGDVDAGGIRRAAQRARPRADRARGPHRHHLARRHRLDQSRRLGQPPRTVRAREAGRHVQERAHPVHVQLGLLAQGPAHRARHRRDEPVHPAVGARALACDQRRAPDPDRHAL